MPRKYDVSPERFVEVWEKSKSSDEAAEILGMPKPIMHVRAAGYRALGVKLKEMPRPKKKLNVEGLNELIASLGPQNQPSEKEVGHAGPFAF